MNLRQEGIVTISCAGKFHAFALAEQMERLGLLDTLFTAYAYQRNEFWRNFVKRIDQELIPRAKISTNIFLAFPIKLDQGHVHIWNNQFDHWVSGQLKKKKSKVFVGWSGMSLHSIRVAKKRSMISIVERGSTHIQYQDTILQEEYKKFGLEFNINADVIKKELAEYELADFISIPSDFVRNSFLQYGVPEKKLIVNPYGAKLQTRPTQQVAREKPFTILYLGTLSYQKGVVYLFQALKKLNIDKSNIRVMFIGKIDADFEPVVARFREPEWEFFGHINFAELPSYLCQCDIGIQPSLQEGLSMVIPQMMSYGIPVIATTNTGGDNIITDGANGFIVPIRNPDAICQKIELLHQDRNLLSLMKTEASRSINNENTWDDYGNRFGQFVKSITGSTVNA